MIGIAISVFFILMGFLIKNGKWYFLMPSYNMMSEEERDAADLHALATVFRDTLIGMAAIILLGAALSLWLGETIMQPISIVIAALVGTPYILVKTRNILRS